MGVGVVTGAMPRSSTANPKNPRFPGTAAGSLKVDVEVVLLDIELDDVVEDLAVDEEAIVLTTRQVQALDSLLGTQVAGT